jgi:hypothetical protein
MKTPQERYRTICCNAKIKHISRAKFVCESCNNDDTMNFVFYIDMIDIEEKLLDSRKIKKN